MTGKEAAQTAKAGWHLVSGWSVTIFIVSGVAGLAISQSFVDVAGWLKDPSVALAIIGAIQGIVRSNAKKVTEEVPEATYAKFYEKQGALQVQVDEGKADHEQCFARHGEHDRTNEELKGRVAKVEHGFERLGGAMDVVKPDWRIVGG